MIHVIQITQIIPVSNDANYSCDLNDANYFCATTDSNHSVIQVT